MDVMAMLKRPFPPSAISWRAGATNAKKNGGKPNKCIALAYIDARDVMERLDYVFGANWMCEYSHADKKTICEISVLVDGIWIKRANGAGDSDIEAEKGAISDAFKRAAVMFGVGRYLYNLPNVWVECDEWGHIGKHPELPDFALPETEFRPLVMEIMGLIQKDNAVGALALTTELDEHAKKIVWSMLDKDTKTKLSQAKDKK